jgi:hypothetical protein
VLVSCLRLPSPHPPSPLPPSPAPRRRRGMVVMPVVLLVLVLLLVMVVVVMVVKYQRTRDMKNTRVMTGSTLFFPFFTFFYEPRRLFRRQHPSTAVGAPAPTPAPHQPQPQPLLRCSYGAPTSRHFTPAASLGIEGDVKARIVSHFSYPIESQYPMKALLVDAHTGSFPTQRIKCGDKWQSPGAWIADPSRPCSRGRR